MSLVAAYSDSESDNENENEKEMGSDLSKVDNILTEEKEESDYNIDDTNFDIEDEDNWQKVSIVNKIEAPRETKFFSKLPDPGLVKETYRLTEEIEDEFLKKKATIEDTLYKKEQALLEKEQTDEKGNHNSKKNQNFLTKFTKKGGKKNQRIQISIPTLQEIGADSDSDSENQGEQQQKFKASKRSSALFSMLPKPKHSVAVSANKNKIFTKEMNRSLVPHTLTKKKEPVKVANVIKPKTISKENNNDYSDDEDSDDEGEISSNFFSIGQSSSVQKLEVKSHELEKKICLKITGDSHELVLHSDKNVVQPAAVVETEIKKDKVSPKNTKSNAFFASLFNKNKTPNNNSITSSATVSSNEGTLTLTPVTVQPASLETTYAVTAPYGTEHALATSNRQHPENLKTSYGVTAAYGVENAPQNQATNLNPVTATYGSCNDQLAPNSDTSQQFFTYSHAMNKEPQQPFDYYNQPNEDLPIEQDAINALQGRKRRRGEDINLIDVNAQDLQSSSEEYLRNLTVDSGYKPKQAKEFGPSSQQKRKHQITYLAFQAKEREFELRQSWADSRASKKQTQSKYGF